MHKKTYKIMNLELTIAIQQQDFVDIINSSMKISP